MKLFIYALAIIATVNLCLASMLAQPRTQVRYKPFTISHKNFLLEKMASIKRKISDNSFIS